MKPCRPVLWALVMILPGVKPVVFSQEIPATQPDRTFAPTHNPPADDPEAAYARAISKRADAIIAALQPLESEHAARVHAILVRQYRCLRDLHDQRDAELSRIDPSDRQSLEHARQIHQQAAERNRIEFYKALAGELSPDQIEIVKDQLTYNKVKVTYEGYMQMLPALTDPQKQRIRDELLAARELAVFGGSAEEKTRFFEKAKGRINNFLSSEGYDLRQASKEWAARRRAQSTQRAT